jgi:hypothetical protein
MRIYFTGARAGNKKFGDSYKKIVESLAENGHDVQYTHIIGKKPQPHEKDFNQTFKKVHNWIKGADVIVAEISTPSSGVGHEIFLSLSERKPVLALYHEDARSDKDATLKGNPSKYLEVSVYNIKTLDKIIKDFLHEAKQKLDTKFILIISPEIDRYLEWAADFKRMHKAQIVRNAVETEMENDKDYQTFLKEKEK